MFAGLGVFDPTMAPSLDRLPSSQANSSVIVKLGNADQLEGSLSIQ